MTQAYLQQYETYQSLVEQALVDAIPQPEEDWPKAGPPKAIAQAMRYSLLAGGKRLRPVLLLAAYEAYSPQIQTAMPYALAVEMIHTYSLIHDDLPAMDDDSLRRGKPTNHIMYGEAMAILAGDALLNLAFETMLTSDHPKGQTAMREIALRTGASGMIAGQTADILFSGKSFDIDTVRYIHQHKTADLLTAPILAGLTLADAPDEALQAGREYGRQLGLAFQITDDLLDLHGDPEVTGKESQQDQILQKLTWPKVVGEQQAKIDAEHAVMAAAKLTNAFGKNKAFFHALAVSLLKRVK